MYQLVEKFSRKHHCPSCSKYWPEGLPCCTRGISLMPSLERKRKIKSQFEILSIPHYVVKTDCSRGARHGPSQWQCDRWKAKGTKRNALKKNHKSFTERWHNDELCRNSSIAAGRTEDCSRYLEFIATKNISYTATRSERSKK